MEEQLISFKTAKLAKEKNFNELVLKGYTFQKELLSPHFGSVFKNLDVSNNIIFAAPTQSLLQRWLREKHKLFISINTYTALYTTYTIYELTNTVDIIYFNGRNINVKESKSKTYDTYEDALENALLSALKLI